MDSIWSWHLQELAVLTMKFLSKELPKKSDMKNEIRASRNPLSVLSGIQLCGLPRALADFIAPCLAFVPTGQPFHSLPETSAFRPHRINWIGFRFCFGANHL